jgi:CheY-like chemotaxis protein
MHTIHLHRLSNDGGQVILAKEIAITRFPWVIGRDVACDLYLKTPFISRRHCVVFTHANEVWVRDLGSRNGTYVNGERVYGAQRLRDRDRLAVAHVAFEIRLCEDAEVPKADRGAFGPGTEPARPSQHVLVVDDNADAAEMLALLLKGWGHDVEVAHDGPAALRAAEAHPPDTVLLDIRLPGMDGYQVAQRLRGHLGFAKTLVAVTGCDPEGARSRSQEVGFDNLLTKPVDPEALRAALHQAPA